MHKRTISVVFSARRRYDADGDMLAMLGKATGIDPDNLLNQMPSPVRDKLLADFVNRLYANQ